jgi:hypothetical protein
MGFFKTNPPKPSIVSHEPPGQPKAGGPVTKYRVLGLWQRDGSVSVPDVLVIELDGGRRTNKPGDVLALTRLEAAVVGKRAVLAPIVGEEE